MFLSNPQNIFLNGLNTKYRAYVGGFGSGKTYVGCLDLLMFAMQNPKTVQGYFGPSYGAIRDIFYPTFEEAALSLGFRCDIKVGSKEIDLYFGRAYYGTIICRSMDNPSTIIGFKIARALVDEIDTLKKEKAEAAWRKIIARMRLKITGVVNGIGVTTTPEGFHFVYERFSKEPTESYSMVQASTYENERFLPDDYIPSLLESYPVELVKAYVSGQFVNLNSGTVYKVYDRIKHRSTETIQPQEPLYIGMDFNVQHMAATVYVLRNDDKEWHAVDEIIDGYDTPDVIRIIQDRYADHKITVYPDSSGANTKSVGASESDISLLRKADFHIRAKPSNPRVKDRVNATNAAFEKGLLFINDSLCRRGAECLEQQSYDANGAPDKSSGNDHQNDATTYPIAYEMAIHRPITKPLIKFAV